MNHSEIDDPILTAYALGELDATERASMEARLQTDAEARQFVEETRAFASGLGAALQNAPEADLTDSQKAAILAGVDEVQPVPGKIVPFLRWAVPLSAAAAITAACIVALRPPTLLKIDSGTGQLLASSDPMLSHQMPKADARADLSKDFSKGPADLKDGEELKSEAEPAIAMFSAPKSLALQESGDDQGAALAGAPGAAPAKRAADLPAIATASRAVSAEMTAADASPPLPQQIREQIRTLAEGGMVPGEAIGKAKRAFSVRDRQFEMERPSIPGLVQREAGNTEAYDRITDNAFLAVKENPLSTFSIDVDTASYSNMRRFIEGGSLPPKDSVRIEELINYFDYDYPQPKGEDPFSVNVEVAPAPWNTKHLLAKIGLKGREIAPEKRPPLNLVFLLDVSGSMDEANKLPLVRQSMKLLVARLNPRDRVAIVVYAGASGMALPSTEASHQKEIVAAIDALSPGGSTNGAAGIQLAYDIAKANFIKDGANRVILCTDGDFNVGVTNQGDLLRMIEDKAKGGTFLTVLGFGMGNYKDSTLEKLADQGNGNYGYVDQEREAKKLLVEQLSGTLVPIAKDTKVQVEFNPAYVGAYRLIGYENRLLKAEDFNDDKKDAGEIGAGHTVTALYEITPVGDQGGSTSVDPLRYQPAEKAPDQSTRAASSNELMWVKLRYKQPDGDTSKLITETVPMSIFWSASVSAPAGLRGPSKDFQFAAAIAEFGMLLRESPFKGDATWKTASDLAENGLGTDARGYRHEFFKLMQQAQRLNNPDSTGPAGE